MGQLFSFIPGYIAPTNHTDVADLVKMPFSEQQNFASQSVIAGVADDSIAEKILALEPPSPLTTEYLASLAAIINAGGKHAEEAQKLYSELVPAAPIDSHPPSEAEPKSDGDAPSSAIPVSAEVADTTAERYVPVHYCPNCGYVGAEDDSDDTDSDYSSDE